MIKFIITSIFLLWGSSVFAQVPKTISYQGVLSNIDGGMVSDGSYNLTFKLYNSESGGQAIWEESQEVVVTSGIFNSILGKTNPFILPFNRVYWLGISVNGNEELTPRTQLTASPYSFNTISISDSIVTSQKIKNGQVVRSINSMKDDVQIVAGDNIDLSMQNNSIVISTQGSGVFPLPYFGEVETSSTAFGIYNNGSGNVASFVSTGQDRINSVLQVSGEGNGVIMNVLSHGNGGAAFFEINDTQNQNPVIRVNNNGLETAAEFTIFNQENDSPAILADQNGLGQVILARNSNQENILPALDVRTEGIGLGLKINHYGASGNIAEFQSFNQSKVSIDKSGNLDTKGSITVGSKIVFPDGTEQSTATLGTGHSWNLTGNVNTSPDTAFIGTTDNQPFEIKVNNSRALRIEPLFIPGGGNYINIIGGSVANSVSNGVKGATIGGGGSVSDGNRITGDYGVISGGSSNLAGLVSTVSGGNSNSASADFSTISGGSSNLSSGIHTTISGGNSNKAGNSFAAVGGGQSNEAAGDFSTIAGGEENKALDFHSTIGGGNNNVAQSVETGGATVSGGEFNQALNDAATVGGGQNNIASGSTSTIGGGAKNTASGQHSSIAGGNRNLAAGNQSAVGGGNDNIASGQNATVPGGDRSHARGDYSFAAGYKARAIHDGSFVWNDHSITTGNDSLVTTADNQFLVRALGGVGIRTNNFEIKNSANETIFLIDLNGNATLSGTLTEQSDFNAKTNFSPVDSKEILTKISSLPISTWSYIDDPDVKHIGPMAQDFKAAFEVGSSETSISVIDRDGVALAAIQALQQILLEKEDLIRNLHRDILSLQDRISSLEKRD